MQDRKEQHWRKESSRDLDAISRQAVRWFVKLRSPVVSSADRHAHSEWLEADARHRRLYDSIADEWAGLDGLSDWAGAEIGQLNLRAKRSMRRRINLYVAGLAAAMAAMALLPWLFNQHSPPAPPHDRYETAKTEQRQVVLKDGSRMHLNVASLVETRFSAHVREVILIRGEGMFDVKHDSFRPFVLRTGGVEVTVLGTRFAVRNFAQGGISVTVLEGRVAVASRPQAMEEAVAPTAEEGLAGRSSVILQPGQQLRIPSAGPVGSPKEINAANEIAWLHGSLVFEATPLREVVREISRYVPGRIRVAEDVPDHPITGIIQIRNPDAMIKLLSQVVPVTPVKESAEVTVLHVGA